MIASDSYPAVHGVVHGGADVAELAALGRRPDQMVDFSANVNPYGPPPGVKAAIAATRLDRYPDRHCVELRAALAASLALPSDWLLCGNGAAELIHVMSQAWVRPGNPVIVATPTFGEYAHAASIAGGTVIEVPWALPLGHGLDWQRLCASVATHRPVLTVICVPNNPTGDLLATDGLMAVVEAVAPSGGLVVVDEAYHDLVLDSASLASAIDICRSHPSHVVVLRSLTKSYALAGLRLGYLVAEPALLAGVRRMCPPWTVNALAQAAGSAALAQPAFVVRSRARLARSKQALVRRLRQAGFPLIPGHANWVLVEVGDAPMVRRELLACGLLVRDCTSFGLPAHIRVAVRREAECRRLVAALAQVSASRTT